MDHSERTAAGGRENRMNSLALRRAFHLIAGRIAPDYSAGVAQRKLLYPRQLPERPWEAPALETACRISFRFGLTGLRWGEEGPVVLLVHGWEGRPTQFRYLIPPLLKAGRQVVALHGPGHAPGELHHATLMESAAAIQEAAVELRNLEAVVGHSMGASAAVIAIANGLPVDRAVLLAPSSAIERRLFDHAEAFGLPREAARRLGQRMEFANGVSTHDVEASRIAQHLHVPALIVHDRADTAVPFEEGLAVYKAWSGAELHATSGLGHWGILTNSDVARKVSAFLTADGVLPGIRRRHAA